jgi:hypothetical protein
MAMNTCRGDGLQGISGDISHVGGTAQPAGDGAGHGVDIGFERRIVFLVMGGVVADHHEHRDVRAPGVVQGLTSTPDGRLQLAFETVSLLNAATDKIEPLVGHAMGGALWYQGEADEKQGKDYLPMLNRLIEGWPPRLAVHDRGY